MPTVGSTAPCCPLRYGYRDLERVEQKAGDHDGPTRLAVQRLDLRVGPEPAAREVDGRDLVLQDRLGQVGVEVTGNDDRGGRADATEGPFGEGRMSCGHGVGHRDVPPEVTTGLVVVVVVVGCVVVVVVVGVAASLLPDEPDVVDLVVVDVDDPVELVLLVWEASEVALTPGCSLATATPISAVAPVAARIAVARQGADTRAGTLAVFRGVVLIGVSNGHAPIEEPLAPPRSRPSVGRL